MTTPHPRGCRRSGSRPARQWRDARQHQPRRGTLIRWADRRMTAGARRPRVLHLVRAHRRRTDLDDGGIYPGRGRHPDHLQRRHLRCPRPQGRPRRRRLRRRADRSQPGRSRRAQIVRAWSRWLRGRSPSRAWPRGSRTTSWHRRDRRLPAGATRGPRRRPRLPPVVRRRDHADRLSGVGPGRQARPMLRRRRCARRRARRDPRSATGRHERAPCARRRRRGARAPRRCRGA